MPGWEDEAWDPTEEIDTEGQHAPGAGARRKLLESPPLLVIEPGQEAGKIVDPAQPAPTVVGAVGNQEQGKHGERRLEEEVARAPGWQGCLDHLLDVDPEREEWRQDAPVQLHSGAVSTVHEGLFVPGTAPPVHMPVVGHVFSAIAELRQRPSASVAVYGRYQDIGVEALARGEVTEDAFGEERAFKGNERDALCVEAATELHEPGGQLEIADAGSAQGREETRPLGIG